MRLDQQSLLGWILELEFNGSRRKLEAFFQFRISGFLQIQLFDFQCCFVSTDAQVAEVNSLRSTEISEYIHGGCILIFQSLATNLISMVDGF